MRTRNIIIIIFTSVACGIIIITVILFLGLGQKNRLVIPGFTQQPKVTQPSPTPAPPNSPKTFKFDSSTDLKAELEKVNPEVLDSDFE